MTINLLPDTIRERYEVYEWRHACAILHSDFPSEFQDIIAILENFHLMRQWLIEPGGRKSQVAQSIDSALSQRGWVEKGFATRITVDNTSIDSPTHKVDCFKNRIALEIEWNNKDPFFDRDLNNFRLLFDLRVISVGIIITRSDELQDIFNDLGRGNSYGTSTTHMSKLLPQIYGGSGGGCPLLVFGITKNVYVEGT